MALVAMSFQTPNATKVSTLMTASTVTGSIFGPMAGCTKAFGRTASSMVWPSTRR